MKNKESQQLVRRSYNNSLSGHLHLEHRPHAAAAPLHVRHVVVVAGAWMSNAAKWAALESASSSPSSSGLAPSGPASSRECRAAQRRQACPEEAQEPSWGTAKGAL